MQPSVTPTSEWQLTPGTELNSVCSHEVHSFLSCLRRTFSVQGGQGHSDEVSVADARAAAYLCNLQGGVPFFAEAV